MSGVIEYESRQVLVGDIPAQRWNIESQFLVAWWDASLGNKDFFEPIVLCQTGTGVYQWIGVFSHNRHSGDSVNSTGLFRDIEDAVRFILRNDYSERVYIYDDQLHFFQDVTSWLERQEE